MKILAIETSCDETAISVVEATGGLERQKFQELSRVVSSQIEIHREFGGVVPNLAKREHQKLLIPVLLQALKDSDTNQGEVANADLSEILTREQILLETINEHTDKLGKPDIDYIAVTTGPGLEPALWVGINFAKALNKMWGIPLVAINHMEGHVMSPLLKDEKVTFPALSLLISGGHTELIEVTDWGEYKLLGITRDDAVGEAFDKVARMLELPYPGGPEIEKLAKEGKEIDLKLPRPMIDADNLDFSFSGLKTAVKYYVDDHGPLTDQHKASVAKEFVSAVVEVLVSKTKSALEQTGAKTLIVGGGVIASPPIRNALTALIDESFPNVSLLIPEFKHCGDNASMIAAAAYIHIEKGTAIEPKEANGSESLAPHV